jgi:UDP-GlcNAc:undecaprenyl-phosphate GlcNAc-1-phosphate transferase
MISEVFLAVILLNIFLFFYISNSRILNLITDKPDNIRKIHDKNTPCIGGFIFIINFMLFFILNEINKNFYNFYLIYDSEEFSIFFFTSLSLFFFLGLLDDIKNVNYQNKLLISLTIITILLLIDNSFVIRTINFSFYLNTIFLNELSIPFTILCILLFINAFNMFDGLNLQAAFYTFYIFLYLIFNNIFFNLILFMFIPLCIFISKNYNGKIFLGNNGSMLLSFFLSLIFIKSYNLGFLEYTDQIVITMIIPGLDMLRLFIQRIFNKKNPFKPDRNHLHHIILNLTKSSNKTVLIIIAICVTPQILSYIGITNLIIIIFSIVIYLFFYFLFLKLSIRNY